MTHLRRHQLAWLTGAGWRHVLAGAPDDLPWDAQALDALRHWADHDLPLVVTRQPVHFRPVGAGRRPVEPITLGLAAPLRWQRRRLLVEAPQDAVRRVGGFARAAEIVDLVPEPARAGWLALCDGLDRLQVAARVYGSCGWQLLTGMAYLHAGSDIDLMLMVESPAQADAVVDLLQQATQLAPRIDGELVFADGAAIAWREWAAWRAGRVDQVLVKRLLGVALEDARSWAMAVG
jgi:phosphoribosyl-dephospho-CoA transferase